MNPFAQRCHVGYRCLDGDCRRVFSHEDAMRQERFGGRGGPAVALGCPDCMSSYFEEIALCPECQAHESEKNDDDGYCKHCIAVEADALIDMAIQETEQLFLRKAS